MILRNKIKTNYTMIPNSIIYDINISSNAFRLLVYLWSKPDKWQVNQNNIAKDLDVHLNTIKNWIKELKELNYLEIKKVNNGQKFEFEYILNYEPTKHNFTKHNLTVDNLTVDQKLVLHSNTEFSNTEFSNTYKEKDKTKRFKKPSLDDLKNYCLEKNLKNVDIEVFMNFYESNGWKVGKNQMKNWKAALSNWNKREFTKPKQKVIGNMNGWYQEEEKELTEEELKELEDIKKLMEVKK